MSVSLHLGDCLDFLRTLDSGSVDAVVTDPPYGLDFRGADWDAFIPEWIAEARRVAPVVVFTTAPTTLWDYPQHAYPRGFPHPSPKPVALMDWLVSSACDEGATVLDPFMGSGTTGVACVNTGRNFIGCEIDPGYFAIAEKRIAAAEAARAELLIA